jgi:hypothetical protein
MKETLTCSFCSKTWKREKSRGRKPTICPKCQKAAEKEKDAKQKEKEKIERQNFKKLDSSKSKSVKAEPIVTQTVQASTENLTYSKVYSSFYPQHPDAEELLETTKNGSSWQCPSCKLVVNPTIRISQPPTHKCSPTSASVKEFIRIG